MLPHLVRIFEAASALGAAASLGYYGLCLCGAVSFLKARPSQSTSSDFCPPVSILKPLKGADPELYECLRSHCLLNYSGYEIIFGVSEAGDSAAAVVERLRNEFPRVSMQLVVCGENLGANTKVSNLAQMVRVARHDYLVVSDSDIRVGPDYLRRVIRPLAEDKTGMVTCLYRGKCAPTLGSRLESLGISTDFCPGVLAARLIEGGIRFGLGSTLAFRRRDLQRAGGFEPLADYLADDYELGRRIAALGLRVELSEEAVETVLPVYSLPEFLSHQLRWARTIRGARPAGYLGLVFTFGLVWAVLVLIFAQGATWAWILLGTAAALRLAVATVVGKTILADQRLPAMLYLIPLRDLLGAGIWLAGFAGRRVVWRGETFTLQNGKLQRGRG